MSKLATKRDRSPRSARKTPARVSAAPERPASAYEPPAFEVIPLDCEITAYAPAGDEPLF